ncbi:hypothetical protein BofuT4_P054760.1 [Botrytis cinerea T4]|uniref:Uncharacterized protein n=1 Tax=Botryotinia fuckeliana (strain T4) TaxID=999810 RepID=G2XVQ5_BOTF4|nr:hypothetical protein BofuT4_P054760.1 [Botrytis cinerea T4]
MRVRILVPASPDSTTPNDFPIDCTLISPSADILEGCELCELCELRGFSSWLLQYHVCIERAGSHPSYSPVIATPATLVSHSANARGAITTPQAAEDFYFGSFFSFSAEGLYTWNALYASRANLETRIKFYASIVLCQER